MLWHVLSNVYKAIHRPHAASIILRFLFRLAGNGSRIRLLLRLTITSRTSTFLSSSAMQGVFKACLCVVARGAAQGRALGSSETLNSESYVRTTC